MNHCQHVFHLLCIILFINLFLFILVPNILLWAQIVLPRWENYPCSFGIFTHHKNLVFHVNPWLIHVNVWQKLLQYCKVISLQLIKINGKEKKEPCIQLSHCHGRQLGAGVESTESRTSLLVRSWLWYLKAVWPGWPLCVLVSPLKIGTLALLPSSVQCGD